MREFSPVKRLPPNRLRVGLNPKVLHNARLQPRILTAGDGRRSEISLKPSWTWFVKTVTDFLSKGEVRFRREQDLQEPLNCFRSELWFKNGNYSGADSDLSYSHHVTTPT